MVDNAGRHVLHYGTMSSCHVSVCQQLVNHTENTGLVDSFGRTALHYAALNDTASTVVQILIKMVLAMHRSFVL